MATITLFDKIHWVTLQAEGVLAKCDLIDAVERFYPQLADRYIIWDLSNVSLNELTEDDLIFLARYFRPQSQRRTGSRTAVVSAGDAMFVQACIYTAVAMLEEIAVDYFVFRTLAEAEEWMMRS